MPELLRLLVDLVVALVPFRVVWQWQRGLYYVGGRYKFTCGPGLKLVLPGLCEVKTVSTVPEVYETERQDITLEDGRPLSYTVSLTVAVIDANLAYNTLGHWEETIVELAARLASTFLADADVKRFRTDRGNRTRLVEDLRKEIDAAAAVYGLTVPACGLNNFSLGIRTVRLLMDKHKGKVL